MEGSNMAVKGDIGFAAITREMCKEIKLERVVLGLSSGDSSHGRRIHVYRVYSTV